MWGIFSPCGGLFATFFTLWGLFLHRGGGLFCPYGFLGAPPAKMLAGAHVLDATFFMQFIFVSYFSDANCKAQVISFVNNFPFMIHTLHL